MEEIKERQVVFLRHLKFPDNNMIDYRMNGRPYLVFKVDQKNAYLFKMSSSYKTVDCYHYECYIGKKSRSNKSYIDLRYVYVINKEELESKRILEYDGPIRGKRRTSNKEIFIDKEDYENIKERLEEIEQVNTLSAIYAFNVSLNNSK